MMNRNKIQKTVLAAMFAALIYAATAFLSVPMPNGYANFGDCLIIVCALCLGPVYGAAAAGIGSAVSDLFLTYVVYAPATFVIKALMAIAVAVIYKAIKRTGFRYPVVSVGVAAFIAEIIMVTGYFIFEIFLLGFPIAVLDLAGNGMQGVVGLLSGTLLYGVLLKTGPALKMMKKI